jgi:hypothetical protein
MDKKRANGQMLLLRERLVLQERFPGASVNIKNGQLRWLDGIRPTPMSRNYLVEITWDGISRPKTFVRDPKLEPPPGKNLQHVYTPDEICLFMPYEWKSTMLIADTIIPWTHEWLFQYELFRLKGDWYGGGHGSPTGVNL